MPTIEQARSWYPAGDPVHGFDHVLRVLRLADYLARLEGADLEVVAAAVLLHDAQVETGIDSTCSENHIQFDSHTPGVRGDHHLISAELAQRVLEEESWPEERIAEVKHCIQAHRYRELSTAPQTLEARVVFDADKLDAIGAVGVARAIAYAVRAGQPFYSRPSTSFLQTGCLEPGEPHSAYHEYLFKLVKIQERLCTKGGKLLSKARQQRMDTFFKGLALEVGE